MANLLLHGVKDSGTKNEYVLMKAVADVDLGDYIVTDTTFRKNGVVSNKARHVYEFKKQVIKKDEWVALFTTTGTDKPGKSADNKLVMHYFYWGLDHMIWNDTGDKAWLLYAPAAERQSKVVAPAK